MSDEVFGLDISADDAALLMIKFIRREWIDQEPMLYTGKWFDYRFLNPVQATYLYAHHFTIINQRYYSRGISSARAPHIRLFRDDMFKVKLDGLTEKEKSERTRRHKMLVSGLWRGRMVADAMGMPYPVYLDRAFDTVLSWWNQRHLPRPTQLYSDLVIDRLSTAWQERKADRVEFSELPQYKNNAYSAIVGAINARPDMDKCILRSQNDHHEHLFELAGMRGNNPELLARLIWQDQVLPESKVKARVSPEIFERVLRQSERFCAA